MGGDGGQGLGPRQQQKAQRVQATQHYEYQTLLAIMHPAKSAQAPSEICTTILFTIELNIYVL